MENKEFLNLIRDRNACQSAIDWILENSDKTAEELWAICPRGDWMFWLVYNFGSLSVLRFKCVEYAADAADYAAEYAAHAARDASVADEYAAVNAVAASVAASVAADAARAADYAGDSSVAAEYAAHAARDASVAAEYAAVNAQWAAEYAARAAGGVAALVASVADAGQDNELRRQADYIREHFTCPI